MTESHKTLTNYTELINYLEMSEKADFTSRYIENTTLLFPNAVPLMETVYTDPKYNNIRRSKLIMLGDSLEKNKLFKTLNFDKKTQLICHIEKCCYKYAKQYAEENDIHIRWDSIEFSSSYHDICYKIVLNLIPEAGAENSYLFALILENPTMTNIPFMTAQEMCPEKYIPILEKIQLMNAEIKVKTSSLYYCPKCKKNETIIRNVQDRAADENSSSYILCIFCSYRWKIGG